MNCKVMSRERGHVWRSPDNAAQEVPARWLLLCQGRSHSALPQPAEQPRLCAQLGSRHRNNKQQQFTTMEDLVVEDLVAVAWAATRPDWKTSHGGRGRRPHCGGERATRRDPNEPIGGDAAQAPSDKSMPAGGSRRY